MGRRVDQRCTGGVPIVYSLRRTQLLRLWRNVTIVNFLPMFAVLAATGSLADAPLLKQEELHLRTDYPWELVAVFGHSDSEKASAIVELESGKQRYVSVGDIITEDTKVHAINSTSITINLGHRLESLYFKRARQQRPHTGSTEWNRQIDPAVTPHKTAKPMTNSEIRKQLSEIMARYNASEKAEKR